MLWQYYTDHIETIPIPTDQGQQESTQHTHDDGDASRIEETSAANDLGHGSRSEETPTASSDYEGATARPYSSLLGKKDITFRVTCSRGGRKHSFSSQDAAKYFGAGLAEYFGWRVKLKEFDIEILLGISGNSVTVSVALTRQPKFKRNIAHFGPTTLRSTIAYGMLRSLSLSLCVCVCVCVLCYLYAVISFPLLPFSSLLRCAYIQPGDVVLDPLCGGGSITIEVRIHTQLVQVLSPLPTHTLSLSLSCGVGCTCVVRHISPSW